MPEEPIEVVYPANDKGKSLFNFTFDEDTELSGYMKVRVWVEARPDEGGGEAPDDMGVFVAVDKLDVNGNSVPFNGSVGLKEDMVTRGWCRASRRELDPVESTEWHPVQKGDSEQKLNAGEVVPLDIEVYPSSTFFSAGETLQLIIAADEIVPTIPYKKDASFNRGRHVLHFGGDYDSHLLVPVIPAKGE